MDVNAGHRQTYIKIIVSEDESTARVVIEQEER
jgi:hypothetical protein